MNWRNFHKSMPWRVIIRFVLILFALIALGFATKFVRKEMSHSLSKPATQAQLQTSPTPEPKEGEPKTKTIDWPSPYNFLWLIPIGVFVWIIWGGRKTPTTPVGPAPLPATSWFEKWRQGWWNRNARNVLHAFLFVFLAILIHVAIYIFWPAKYQPLMWNGISVFNQLAVITALVVINMELKKNEKGLLYLAKLAARLLLIIVIFGNFYVAWDSIVSKVWWSSGPPMYAQTAPQNTVSAPVFPYVPQDNEEAVFADRFWREGASSVQDAAHMLWTAKLESSFRQFNEDGTVLTHTNKNGTTDYGFMEINEIWLPQAKELGYDINTFKGNLDMALWIYKNHGVTEWATYSQAIKLTMAQGEYAVTAPVGRFGERIPIVTGTILQPEGPVLYRDDQGRLHEDDKGAPMGTLIVSTYVEPQSRTLEPVKVTVSR